MKHEGMADLRHGIQRGRADGMEYPVLYPLCAVFAGAEDLEAKRLGLKGLSKEDLPLRYLLFLLVTHLALLHHARILLYFCNRAF